MNAPTKRRAAAEIGKEIDEATDELATQIERERDAKSEAHQHRIAIERERKHIAKLEAELHDNILARLPP